MGEVGDGRKKRRSRWSLALKKLLDLGRRKSDGRGRGRTRHGGVILEGKRVNGTSHLLLPRDVRGRQPISDAVVNTSRPNASRAIQKPGPPALSCLVPGHAVGPRKKKIISPSITIHWTLSTHRVLNDAPFGLSRSRSSRSSRRPTATQLLRPASQQRNLV